MVTAARRIALVLCLLLAGATEGRAQETTSFCETPPGGIDPRGLYAVYCSAPPAATHPLRWAHTSARPVFYGAVPLAWAATLARRGDGRAAAYRLTLTQGTTYGGVLALKHLVGRPRPYHTRNLTSRSGHYSAGREDPYTSFPSGHAALSAALATSWSLSYPRWYVVGPGAAWAAGVTLSRVYLGVHYPSDVVVGAAIGIGVATLIHHLRTSLTPPRLRTASPGAAATPAPLHIRIHF